MANPEETKGKEAESTTDRHEKAHGLKDQEDPGIGGSPGKTNDPKGNGTNMHDSGLNAEPTFDHKPGDEDHKYNQSTEHLVGSKELNLSGMRQDSEKFTEMANEYIDDIVDK